jgi:signal transduction histidine kinase
MSQPRPYDFAPEEPLDFELLFRSAPSLLLVLDAAPGFRILAASDAYLRATRAARDKIIGRPLFEAFPENPEGPRPMGAVSLQAALERLLATRRADALNSPVFFPDGRLRYIIHRIDSIEVEILRNARERDDAIRRLKTANEELEAFAYSASHDLRGPLRAIDGFCRIFEQMRGASMDDQVRRLLTRIGANVQRMEDIIHDLLELSRVGRARMSRGRVDVTALAHRVVDGLAARDPERVVAVEVAAGLEAWADEGLVTLVLENLIGNAWKYTSRRAGARIEIGRRSVVGQGVFHVRDNGAGFDMDRADKLFAPFVRLHSAAEFEGHGVGLATVKRIVERHGGEIWAEAMPGRGATFHFTLSGSPESSRPDA